MFTQPPTHSFLFFQVYVLRVWIFYFSGNESCGLFKQTMDMSFSGTFYKWTSTYCKAPMQKYHMKAGAVSGWRFCLRAHRLSSSRGGLKSVQFLAETMCCSSAAAALWHFVDEPPPPPETHLSWTALSLWDSRHVTNCTDVLFVYIWTVCLLFIKILFMLV